LLQIEGVMPHGEGQVLRLIDLGRPRQRLPFSVQRCGRPSSIRALIARVRGRISFAGETPSTIAISPRRVWHRVRARCRGSSRTAVKENLLLGAAVGRKGPWTVDTVCELFPVLRQRADSLGTAMSGGQQQMLAIGRALMANPALLVLDEPSEGLAPVIVDELGETLVRLAAETGILRQEFQPLGSCRAPSCPGAVVERQPGRALQKA
jgi:branched-chain amino acid transport system ATP-binding protein